MSLRPSRTLEEACRCKNFWGLSQSRNGNSLDKAEDDFVKRYEDFRHECPNASKPSHAAFCQRCDNSFPSHVGGADFLRKQGIVQTNPFEKFPEPLAPRKGPKVSPVVWESLGSFIPRVPLAPKNTGRKIKGLTEVTDLEKDLMADNEATRALFRDLLDMTSGGTCGGRSSMQIPQDIMDSLAGDAAQESMARDKLIMEMNDRDSRQRDPAFISLDLMEMNSDNVDAFLGAARKKIIKRSKPTRKACCAKIGGVLDQIMGAGGGDENGNLDLQGVRDRGKMDPIGNVDSVDEGTDEFGGWTMHRRDAEDMYTRQQAEKRKKKDPNKGHPNLPKVKHPTSPVDHANWKPKRNPMNARGPSMQQNQSVEFDLMNFIAEEFFPFEHDQNCAFSTEKSGGGVLGESRISKGYGLLRDHYHLNNGDQVSREKVEEDLSRLSEQGNLTGSDKRLFDRLNLFVSAQGRIADPSNSYQEDADMEPSNTAFALSGFMEAAGGKGSPDSGMLKRGDAGELSVKTRADNSEYPTALTTVKGGGSKTAGAPRSAKGAAGGHTPRWQKDADPIGEDDEIYEGSMSSERMIRQGEFATNSPRSRYKAAQSDARNVARKTGFKATNAAGQGAAHVRNTAGRPLKPRKVTTKRVGPAAWAEIQKSDVDYDGPQISETAHALSGFMEASGQYASAKQKLALRNKDAGDLELGKRGDTRENLGGPLQKADGKRGSLDVYDDGGKLARFLPKANPIGGAVPAKQSASRMKK